MLAEVQINIQGIGLLEAFCFFALELLSSGWIAEPHVLQLPPVDGVQPFDGAGPLVILGVHHHRHESRKALGIQLLSAFLHDSSHQPQSHSMIVNALQYAYMLYNI